MIKPTVVPIVDGAAVQRVQRCVEKYSTSIVGVNVVVRSVTNVPVVGMSVVASFVINAPVLGVVTMTIVASVWMSADVVNVVVQEMVQVSVRIVVRMSIVLVRTVIARAARIVKEASMNAARYSTRFVAVNVRFRWRNQQHHRITQSCNMIPSFLFIDNIHHRDMTMF